jgi:hypothetical protein
VRWLHPPRNDGSHDRDSFDPVVEGARYRLSPELLHAMWARAVADASESDGRDREDDARARFHQLAASVASGKPLHLDIGRVTRVDDELAGARARRWLAPSGHRPTGKQTLTDADARRVSAAAERAPGDTSDSRARSKLDDYRVLGLESMLQWLAVGHPLRQEVIAAAALDDRSIAGRATHWCEPLPSARAPNTTSSGAALWQAAERRAVTLYRRALGTGAIDEHDPAVELALRQRGAGQRLHRALRRELERRLGVSLADVRVHTDAVAAKAAQALGAEAFTVGDDIFFAAGAFDPDTQSGRRLLVHELTHVVQSRRLGDAPTHDGVRVSQPGEPHEQEAEAAAERSASEWSNRLARLFAPPGTAPMGHDAAHVHGPGCGHDHAGDADPAAAEPDARAPRAQTDEEIAENRKLLHAMLASAGVAVADAELDALARHYREAGPLVQAVLAGDRQATMTGAERLVAHAAQRHREPLDTQTREMVEHTIGQRLPGVDVIVDPSLPERGLLGEARSGAIYLAPTVPGPDDPLGRRVRLHEAAHVAQTQAPGGTAPGDTAAVEADAEAVADAAAHGQQRPVGVAASPGGAYGLPGWVDKAVDWGKDKVGDIADALNPMSGCARTSPRSPSSSTKASTVCSRSSASACGAC